jgi:hypothetical protein
MSWIIAGSAAVSIVSGLFSSGAAGKRKRAEAARKAKLQAKLTNLENNRQTIINPYEGVTSLSGMLSNPMANLSVATQAAEMQIEQADISLANTLDTIRSTGASAGGATALAQAALQSKKGVTASIEQQEKNNEDKRAAGEQRLQEQQMSEEQRMQQADVAGKSFVFNQTENREMQQLNRVAAQISGAQRAEAQAASDQSAAITGMVGGLASIGSAAIGSGK